MDTAYRDWEKRRREKGRGRARTGRSQAGRGRRGGVSLGPRERRRLVQLAVCLALFLTVYVGKGIFPGQLLALRSQLTAAMGADVDFAAAFNRLGRALSAGEPVGESLEALCLEVFGAGPVEVPAVQAGSTDTLLFQAQLSGLTGAPGAAPAARLLALVTPEQAQSAREARDPPAPQASAQPEVTAQPEVSTQPEAGAQPEVTAMGYDGPALPAGASMDRYALHLDETVTPVLGWVSSPFGWREHPVDGEEKFHNGVDLAVNNGTEIGAFADGVVEYIGDSPEEYGLYLKIDHGGGVSTFYAHCGQLLVGQGEQVRAGQTVALSGDTGNATGPHLHFELKKDGVRLNPVYYIDTR